MGWRRERARATPEDDDDDADASVLALVAEGLGATDSGVEFVYQSLDRLRDRTGADDLIVIIDEPQLGRQAFRVGRTPLDSVWARDLVASGPSGLHATPEPIEGVVAKAVIGLCTVALRLEAALHDSLHDHLTGLLNRRAFDEVLADACARASRYGWPFGLVLFDVDEFKAVNDRLGHPAGDLALQAVGAELNQHLRVGDSAARLGGDEFAVILPNLRDTDASELTRRLERAIEEAVPGAHATLTAGVALAPRDGDTPTALYHWADEQLYERKQLRHEHS